MLEDILMYATVTVAVLIAVLNIIAPLTKTDWDNKALSLLRKFEELILKALIPQARAMLAEAKGSQELTKRDTL